MEREKTNRTSPAAKSLQELNAAPVNPIQPLAFFSIESECSFFPLLLQVKTAQKLCIPRKHHFKWWHTCTR